VFSVNPFVIFVLFVADWSLWRLWPDVRAFYHWMSRDHKGHEGPISHKGHEEHYVFSVNPFVILVPLVADPSSWRLWA
jgi:hypothetical protein